MNRLIVFLTVAFFTITFLNCASSSVGVATSNRPIPNTTYETTKSVEKTFTWYAVDIVLYGKVISEPPFDSIYESLMEGEDADAVVNIRYWNDKSVFGPWTRYRFSVKGDLVKFTQPATITPPRTKR